MEKVTVWHRSCDVRVRQANALQSKRGYRIVTLLRCCLRCPAERHAGVDRRAASGVRFDGKLSAHQLYPLRHADEAKPGGLHCPFDVKTRSRIAHTKIYRIRRCAQLRIEVPHSAVLDCIVQSFL